MVERDDYTREGFEPSSLTMPQLRNILVEHEVPFGSAAKKGDLVNLFNAYVQPKTAQLRTKNATIVASSSGIIDMRQDTEITPEQTPAKRKPGRPRKSEAATPAQTPAKTPAKAKTARTPGRKKSSLAIDVATATESEAEPEAKPAPKAESNVEVPLKRGRGRPRKSAPATVAAPAEASEPEDTPTSRRVTFGATTSPPASTRKASRLSYGGKSDDDGTFSDSNPFQSGSEASPAPGIAAKAAASARKPRRKTTDGTSILRKKTSSSSLTDRSPKKATPSSSPRRAEAPQNYMDKGTLAVTPPRHVVTEDLAASTDKGAEADDDDFDLDTFTSPSALAKIRNMRRKNDKQRRREDGSSRSLGDYLTRSIFTIVTVAVLSWAVWYARDSRALGFCDTNSSTNAIVDDRHLTALAFAKAHNETIEDNNILPSLLKPECTPCPPHANCAYGKIQGCDSDDWVLQSNWKSHLPLASYVLPLSLTSPACFPDTQKLVLAAELADSISSMLAEFKGEVVCGTQKSHGTVRKLGKTTLRENGNLTYAIGEQAVKRSMQVAREEGVSEDYFEQVWYMAMFELTDPRSNVVRIPADKEGEVEYFLAAKQPNLSLSCRSRMAFKGWVLRARLYFAIALSVVAMFFYVRHRLVAARAESARVAALVTSALERLQEQEYLHGVDPVLYPDDFVPLSHLRDHILAEEHKATVRNRLWKKVAKVVEENSNVRTRQAQKKGEWLRVWQWVGVEGFKGYANTPARGTPLQVENAGERGRPIA